MAQTPIHFTVSAPVPSIPISGPMVSYAASNAGAALQSQPGHHKFADLGAVGGGMEAIGTGTQLAGGHGGVSISFSGPVHVHVDNMYMYDVGADFRRGLHLTQGRPVDNELMALAGPPAIIPAASVPTPVKASRKRSPPKKKTSALVPAPAISNGNGSDEDFFWMMMMMWDDC